MNHAPYDEGLKKAETALVSFRSQIGPLFYLVTIFFLNFLSRIVLAPLMPTIEEDLRVGHEKAGSFFLIISLGYCIVLLGSSFVSSRLTHRKTIILSSIAIGGALWMVMMSHSLWGIYSGLLLLGMGAGLYLPSGIATITELVHPKHWGKAIAIHELAPNLSFIVAPLLAEVLLGWWSWQGVLLLIGIASVLSGTAFAFFGKGGHFSGEALNPRTLRSILTHPSLWIMVALFTLGIGASLGVYTMIPLYFVSERGMDRTWTNTLLALSRISTLGMAILMGWVTDRLGLRITLKGVLIATSVLTIMLGGLPGSWIVLIVFLQPMMAASFFPAGFAALSRMGSPHMKSWVVSFTLPISFLLGGGAIPAGIGFIGEVESFSLGFILLGGLLLGGAVLVRYLKFSDDIWNGP